MIDPIILPMSSRKMSKDPEGSIEISGETFSSPEVFSVVAGVQNNVSSIQEHVESISNKIIRIYLIRHYPSTDESDTTYYKTLDEIPKKERASLEKVYAEIFSLPEKTLFMYDEQDGLERVRFTAEDLLKKYGTHIPVKNIIKDISLRGSYDDKEKPLPRKKRTINEMMELESVIREQDLQDIDTIVIIGNRTYCEPFDLLSGGKKDILQKDLEVMGYLFRDFNSALEPILSKQDELKIRPEDFMDFQLLFPEIENKSCQNAQNLLVSKFCKESHLFEKYFTDITSPLSLRIFCLANLIKHGEYDTIETYYFSQECQTLSENEGMVFLKNIKKDRVRSLVRKLFISREEFWKDFNPKVLKNSFGEQEYEILELNRESYNSALVEQKRSLDNMVIQRTPGAILPRSVHYTKTDTRSENINFDQILKSGGKYVLRAHVGQGKSFWLTEFVKYTALQNTEVLFYPAKTLGQKTIAEIDAIFDVAKQRQSILCIDAIDEILAENIKKYIKDKIERFQGACIITARESEYKPDNNDGFTGTLELSPIDAITFLKSRFQGDEAKFVYVYGILKKNHLDVDMEGNPLLLTLVVLLVNMTPEEKEEYKNLGILSLEDIKSKSDLYESVSRFILAKHTKFIKGIACTKEELSGMDNGITGKRLGFMDMLGNIAYEIAKNPTSIGHDSEIKDLITKDLSLLYFDTLAQSYQFTHRSFYEFFLAKHSQKLPEAYRGEGWHTTLIGLFEDQWIPITTEKLNLFLGSTHTEMVRHIERGFFLKRILCSDIIWAGLKEEDRSDLIERAKFFITQYPDTSYESYQHTPSRSLSIGLALRGDIKEMNHMFEASFCLRSSETILLANTYDINLQDILFLILRRLDELENLDDRVSMKDLLNKYPEELGDEINLIRISLGDNMMILQKKEQDLLTAKENLVVEEQDLLATKENLVVEEQDLLATKENLAKKEQNLLIMIKRFFGINVEHINLLKQIIGSSEENIQLLEESIQLSEESVQLSEENIQLLEKSIQLLKKSIDLCEQYLGVNNSEASISIGFTEHKMKTIIKQRLMCVYSDYLQKHIKLSSQSPLGVVHLEDVIISLIIHGHVPTIQFYFSQIDRVLFGIAPDTIGEKFTNLTLLLHIARRLKECPKFVQNMILEMFDKMDKGGWMT